MKITSGKLYRNKTWLYLFPCLKYYGDRLNYYLKSFYKVGIGIGDTNYLNNNDSIFILFDLNTTINKKSDIPHTKAEFEDFLEWLRIQDFYETDYLYDISQNNCMHMVVIKIPDIHLNSYSKFLAGKYSEMFTKREVNNYFAMLPIDSKASEIANIRIKDVRGVFNKSEERVSVFTELVNERFNTNIHPSAFEDAELDFPIEAHEEIFNLKPY